MVEPVSVKELSQLHKRYVDLSDRFKAAWTFHQFLQGLKKVFAEPAITTEGFSFQHLYARLKGISQSLNTAATTQLRDQLEQVENELNERIEMLRGEDSKIEPSLLRQFFARVKNYDEKILIQLLRFYMATQQGRPWEPAQLDKADFLLTKLGEEIQELRIAPIERDPTRLRSVLQGLWAILKIESPSEEQADSICKEILSLRQAVGSVRSLDQLNEKDLVRKYRAKKHSFGALLFVPKVALTVLEANLHLRETIQKLYQMEEQRIAAEYQEVFELERGAPSVAPELDVELRDFRQDIERFERHLGERNVRLNELAHIRERVRYLIPRLRESGAREVGSRGDDTGETVAVAASDYAVAAPLAAGSERRELDEEGIPKVRPEQTLRIRTAHAEILGDSLRRLLKVLEGSDWEASAKAVTVTPEARPLRLQPRDVLAYRRLHAPESCDQPLEQFLLETAAIRVRITEEAEEIIGLLDEQPEVREGQLFDQARETTRLADAFDYRFSHFISQALQDGRFAEAQNLQTSRMRLLRDYSGLWLLAFG